MSRYPLPRKPALTEPVHVVRVYQGPNRHTMVGSLAAICSMLETRCAQEQRRSRG